MVASGKVRINVNQRFALKDAADAHKALEARATSGSKGANSIPSPRGPCSGSGPASRSMAVLGRLPFLGLAILAAFTDF